MCSRKMCCNMWRTCSKELSKVTLYRTCTWTLTFENFFLALGAPGWTMGVQMLAEFEAKVDHVHRHVVFQPQIVERSSIARRM